MLAVATGDYFIMGHKGAGTSTVVDVLMGTTPGSFGDALIAGYSVTNQLSDVQQNIGICPQHSVFWETLSALENILFFIRLKGSTKSRSEDVALARTCLHEVCSDFRIIIMLLFNDSEFSRMFRLACLHSRTAQLQSCPAACDAACPSQLLWAAADVCFWMNQPPGLM